MKRGVFFKLTWLLFMSCSLVVSAQDTASFKEIKGSIIDQDSKKPLVFADIVITNSNMSVVTNTDGEFILKIPKELLEGTLTFSHLGYHTKVVNISEYSNNDRIYLEPTIIQLDEVKIASKPKDAKALVLETLSKKSSLYSNDNTLMTAFYRETIKKRRRNASLSEAVVKIHKQPYKNYRFDDIELIKSRKKTDYSRLDTLALKLQGGPFSNLYIDLIKYPDFIFDKENIEYYTFSFDASTQIDNNPVYVVNFKQLPNMETPLYYGTLYIDAETLALKSALFHLNVKNKTLASEMYVRKKPRHADVYPTEASYRVNYRTQNGKWYYAYSNILLTFKVNWEGKLFNSTYTLNSEMAITDWKINDMKLSKNNKPLLLPSTILSDQTSGFADPEFWGAYNIIEPEKSIETAIEKIKKQLERT
ncbi:carboxypeptidase-like regulatory domain-containing protein [Confluentibacter sediminis]|uniref:carboxypeptidase-like regulatory domain-containing protein n=1 Tax=Confluentibacter sediminis TaxID=2219045 RepID=UPI000DAB59F7|nr:carboxypeptidase-like regulatory domain-containing protein [Confluentibacter sediminis]